MVKIATPIERLVEELFKESSESERCPFVRKDENGAYCSKNLKEGANIGETRRLVCDYASLQLWCLDKEKRYKKCIFYKGEPLE